MAKYLIEASYTADGVKGLARTGGSSRRSAAESMAREMGGSLESFYFAFGDADAFVVLDLPDNVTAAAVSMAVNQSGFVRCKTTPLLTVEEVDDALGRGASYRPPGT